MSDFDINKIATDLNGKADLDLTNTIGALSASSKNYFSGLGMPSDRYIDLTLGASGTQHTAPANGWVYCNKVSGGAQYLLILNITKGFGTEQASSGSGVHLKVFIPVVKNDIFQVEYSASGTLNAYKFIYAEGESEE